MACRATTAFFSENDHVHPPSPSSSCVLASIRVDAAAILLFLHEGEAKKKKKLEKAKRPPLSSLRSCRTANPLAIRPFHSPEISFFFGLWQSDFFYYSLLLPFLFFFLLEKRQMEGYLCNMEVIRGRPMTTKLCAQVLVCFSFFSNEINSQEGRDRKTTHGSIQILYQGRLCVCVCMPPGSRFHDDFLKNKTQCPRDCWTCVRCLLLFFKNWLTD